jgi:hypothetical protein
MSSAINPIESVITYIFKNNKKSKVNKKNYNPKNQFKNQVKEQNTVLEIYDKLYHKNYEHLLSVTIASLSSAEDIDDLLKNFFDELKKYEYTNSELMAISTLLYRLANIRFVNVELPEQFPNHSRNAISNIRNKKPNDYKYIDRKIKEIVKNLISHYKLDIKNNSKYNSSIPNQLALKLKKILFSFIIDFTRPSSEPLSVESNFQEIENQVAHISTLSQNQLPRKLEKHKLVNFYPNL